MQPSNGPEQSTTESYPPGTHTYACLTTFLDTADPACPCQKPKVDLIVVSRMLQLYDPFSMLLGDGEWLTMSRAQLFQHMKAHPAEPDYVYDTRAEMSKAWHWGRVRYFFDLFMRMQKVEPIVVDNHCDHGHIYPTPVLCDGHHRLAAAHLAAAYRIPSSYSGRIDLLAWLRGDTDEKPEE